MKNVIIIGGMAGGCKTAVRLKRISPAFEITLIESKSFISYGTCGMPFYASGEVDAFDDLNKTPFGILRNEDYFRLVKGVNVLTNTIAYKIDKYEKQVYCKNICTGEEFTLSYDYLVLATGAEPLIPKINIQSVKNVSTFHNPLDAKKFRELAEKGKIGSSAIIGGGYIGCELAEALTAMWGIETHLIEKENRLLPRFLDKEISLILEKALENEGINLHLSNSVSQIIEQDDGSLSLRLNDDELVVDYVFICTGIKPKVELAEQLGLSIGNYGGILVDEEMRSREEGIWAVGDCVEVKNLITGKFDYFPLGSLANRQGRVAANSISNIIDTFKGAIGTNSIRVFGLTVASAGLNSCAISNEPDKYESVVGCWYDRPDYMPESKSIFGKLIYQKHNLRLIGLQLVGYGEVTRYIDVFSALASNGLACQDLMEFEHSYTPPHSSPLNPLNFLGQMAMNQHFHNVKCVSPLAMNEFDGIVIDVRELYEVEDVPVPINSVHIPLEKIKDAMMNYDKRQNILVLCQRGSRSYEAARNFVNSGFQNVSYLGGGLQLALSILDKKED
jgi:NADPH-dependent 2,4-dienoyl-CoA reductase/sulfur reductase-like enzyme/rhodanese-related sulfurtransferase